VLLMEDPVDVPKREGGVGIVRSGAMDSGEVVHWSLIVIIGTKDWRGVLIETIERIRRGRCDHIRDIPSGELREN
jgi:hypothetical protein